MIKCNFDIPHRIRRSDDVYGNIQNFISRHGGGQSKYEIVLKIAFNSGGEISVIQNLITDIENAMQAYTNLRFSLVFSGYAMSAAAYLFCYFTYYSPVEGVKIRNSTKLCLVYHKPRLEVGLQKALVFASNPIQMARLSATDRTAIIDLTQQFDNVFEVMVTLRRIAGYEIEQHLQDSYNANGDVAIPLPQGIQT